MPPQLWVVGGPNGAGKTTLVTMQLAKRLRISNPDEIAQNLPLVRGLPDARRAGARAIAERAALLRTRESFAVETTLTGASAIKLMRKAREGGYKITLVYVGLNSADLSAERVADRVAQGGHDVPLDAIARRYPASLANLPRALALADRFYLFDNSEARRRLLIIGKDGRMIRLGSDMPHWLDGVMANSGGDARR